jgi:pimeloyl-ACP methyl ester carboxylesterase
MIHYELHGEPTDAMERRIDRARKVVLGGAGHAANIDAPAQFNRAVRDFLDAL